MKDKLKKEQKTVLFPYIAFFVVAFQLFIGLSKYNVRLISRILISLSFYYFFITLSKILYKRFGNVQIPQRKLEIFFIIFVIALFSSIIIGIFLTNLGFFDY